MRICSFAFASKRLSARVFVAGFALMAAVSLRAATIDIGVLSFDNIVPASAGSPGVNGFTIYNFTGTNSTPGNALSGLTFDSSSVLLNGSQLVEVGDLGPGNYQPTLLEFSTESAFSSALFSATLSSSFFTFNGVPYEATSTSVSADLLPSSGDSLQAGVDFVTIAITANPATLATPEPNLVWLAGLAVVGFGLMEFMRLRRARPEA